MLGLTHVAKVLLWLKINIFLQTAIQSALVPHCVWDASFSAAGNSSTSSKKTKQNISRHLNFCADILTQLDETV